MNRICITISLIVVLILIAPVYAADRIPAINTMSGQAVLVPQRAVDNSPALEAADVVVEVDGTVFFCRYKDDFSFDDVTTELSEYIISEDWLGPCPYVSVGGSITADQVEGILLTMMTNVDAYSGYQS